MQLFKHMEVVLMLAFGILCATVALRPAAPGPHAAPGEATAAITRADQAAPMPVVHIIGRRMTPDEKRAGANRPG